MPPILPHAPRDRRALPAPPIPRARRPPGHVRPRRRVRESARAAGARGGAARLGGRVGRAGGDVLEGARARLVRRAAASVVVVVIFLFLLIVCEGGGGGGGAAGAAHLGQDRGSGSGAGAAGLAGGGLWGRRTARGAG